MGRNAIGLFLCAALVGCGSVKDSGFADAGVDASTIDADETGMATVVTQSALFGDAPGAPAGNIDIISMLPDNTVLESKQTDAGGNATIKVYPGGTVTAIYPHVADMGTDLITWAGVKPGDTLTFGSRNPNFTGANMNLGTQTYSWPAQTGVANFFVSTSCQFSGFGSATSGAMSEFSSCHSEPMDVLYFGLTQPTPTSPFVLSHFSSRQNISFMNGANVAIGGWQNAVNASVNVTGLPAEVTNLQARFAVVIDGGKTERTPPGGGNANGVSSGGAFTGNFPWSPTGERTSATLFMQRAGNFGQARVLDFLPSNATSWTVASPQLPPWVEGTFLTSAALRLVNWILVPEANSAHDAVMLQVSWSTCTSTTRPCPQFVQSRWDVVLPPGTSAIALPKLGAAFEGILPQEEFGLGLNRVQAIEIPTVNSYDAIRALPSATLSCADCAVRAGEIQRVITSGF